MTSGFAVFREAIQIRTCVTVREGNDTDGRRFLMQLQAAAPGEESFWCRLLEGNTSDLDKLIRSGTEVEVSFANFNSHVFFDTVMLTRKWWGSRVQLRWPLNMHIVERRESSREPIPDDVVVKAMLSDAEGKVRVEARLGDISMTGASFLCENSEPLAVIQKGGTIGLEVKYGPHQHRLAAVCRYSRPISPGLVRVGTQFEAEKILTGAALTRFRTMLEELERLRVRRTFRTQLTKGCFEAA
jgi:hypothetical protein